MYLRVFSLEAAILPALGEKGTAMILVTGTRNRRVGRASPDGVSAKSVDVGLNPFYLASSCQTTS